MILNLSFSSFPFISHRVSEALSTACRLTETPALKLVKANATRWSSFYACIDSIKRAEMAIKLMIDRDKGREETKKVFKPSQLEKVRMVVHRKMRGREVVSNDSLMYYFLKSQITFTSVEWAFMGEMVDILRPFTKVTTDLQGQAYETASLALPMILACYRGITKDKHKGSKERKIKDKDLSVTARAFRQALRIEFKQRFKLDGAGLNAIEKRKIVDQFYMPTFFNPKYKLNELPLLSKHMVQLTERIVREEMEIALQPLLDFLTAHYDQWLADNQQGKRKERSGGNESDRPRKKGRSDSGGMSSDTYVDQLLLDSSDEEGDEEEEQQEHEEENPLDLVKPQQVINEIINKELQNFAARGSVQSSSLDYWRSQLAREGRPVPVLCAVVTKHLCTPASSSKCEQVFSQGGIIDTKLRNRLMPLSLELLVYLKCEWDDSLYYMSHSEKCRILREWKELAAAKGVADPTDRDYGIEGEVDMDEEAEGEVANIDVDLVDGRKGKKGKKKAEVKQKARLAKKAAKDTVDEAEDDEDDVISIWSTDDEYDINLNEAEFIE